MIAVSTTPKQEISQSLATATVNPFLQKPMYLTGYLPPENTRQAKPRFEPLGPRASAEFAQSEHDSWKGEILFLKSRDNTRHVREAKPSYYPLLQDQTAQPGI